MHVQATLKAGVHCQRGALNNWLALHIVAEAAVDLLKSVGSVKSWSSCLVSQWKVISTFQQTFLLTFCFCLSFLSSSPQDRLSQWSFIFYSFCLDQKLLHTWFLQNHTWRTLCCAFNFKSAAKIGIARASKEKVERQKDASRKKLYTIVEIKDLRWLGWPPPIQPCCWCSYSSSTGAA